MLLAALALMAQADAPWEGYKADPVVAWSGENMLGEKFRIEQRELEAPSHGNWISFWLRGEHSANPKVPYRTSLWKFTILCKRSMRLSAYSTFAADGSTMDEEDFRYGQGQEIRPDTIYSDIAEKLCPPKR